MANKISDPETCSNCMYCISTEYDNVEVHYCEFTGKDIDSDIHEDSCMHWEDLSLTE